MTEEDVALFHQAEQLANAGQKQEAYNLFRPLRDRNPDRIEILFWIVETTPYAVESEQTLATIKQLQPNHPWITRTEGVHQRRFGKAVIYAPPPPVLRCPYCGWQGPAFVRSKISTGGWITFIVVLIIFFPLCWIGFLIQENYYVCGRCGSRITTVG